MNRNRAALRVALITVLLSLSHIVPTVADGARVSDDAERAQQRERATLINGAHPHLDSQLNQLVADAARDPRTARLPLTQDDAPAVEVRLIDPGAQPAVIAYLVQHGGNAHVVGDALEAYAPVNALAGLSELPGVERVRALPPPVAHVEAQGAAALGSPGWNTAGYTGAGVKVGVIDVGFLGLDSLLGTELPAEIGAHCFVSIGLPSDALSDCETRQKHGTAVAEALLDVAP
jgi:hypothetical protein